MPVRNTQSDVVSAHFSQFLLCVKRQQWPRASRQTRPGGDSQRRGVQAAAVRDKEPAGGRHRPRARLQGGAAAEQLLRLLRRAAAAVVGAAGDGGARGEFRD